MLGFSSSGGIPWPGVWPVSGETSLRTTHDLARPWDRDRWLSPQPITLAEDEDQVVAWTGSSKEEVWIGIAMVNERGMMTPVYTGIGGCSSSQPASAKDTYYRNFLKP